MTIAAGAECFLMVQQTSGSVAVPANIVVTSNAPGSPQTFVVVPVSVGSPSLVYSPATLEFGPQLTGTTSAPQTITVYNATSQAVPIGNIQMNGADFLPLTIVPPVFRWVALALLQ